MNTNNTVEAYFNNTYYKLVNIFSEKDYYNQQHIFVKNNLVAVKLSNDIPNNIYSEIIEMT